ncbi:uncharacterized protein LOC114129948 isoform X1 [Aphis gossypii]|uniref:uncharacterized protein LOC114129948 isoform X1 n=1 Tax=Aphis gossypii TaxID=80765 RepID=UPI002158A223|nr:uncharacterized protein LOC114129948 isoform X1 [Aphis gossypii]
MNWRTPLTSSQVLEFLPLNTWTEVILISLEPNENGVYIATTEDKKIKQFEDMNKMSVFGDCFEKVKEFKASEIVAVIIDENWYRGRMINYNEFKFNDTRIELIDVGCFYQTKLDNLFVLPYFLLYEQLALPIQFQEFTPKTTKLTIKPNFPKSKLHEGIVLVDVFYNNIKLNNEDEKNQLDTKNKKCITYSPARQEEQKNVSLINGDYCFIQMFNDLSNIYVCKVVKNIENENYTLCDVDDVLSKTIYCKDQKLKKYPILGDTVKVFSFQKQDYYRAKILKKNNDQNSYDVFFIDYGNIETIMSSEIYELPQELCCKPGLIIKVGISDLVPVENNSLRAHEKIKELFEIFIKNKKIFQIEFDETPENYLQNVKFKEIENGLYINDFIKNCFNELSEIECQKSLHTHFKINNNHHDDINLGRKLNNNDIVYLKSFQPHNIVYVIKDIKLFNEITFNITQDKNSILKTDFNEGDIVKVISGNSTYRAKIQMKLSKYNSISVINIDTGAYNFVKPNSIYELSNDLMKIPRLSIRLKVYDLLKINANTGDKDLLISYIKSIENIPLLVKWVQNDSSQYKYSKKCVILKRTDNSESIFTEFFRSIKGTPSFICNEMSNCNVNDEVINEFKKNLKIDDFENVKLKNGDYCIITYFKNFKDIYICKAGNDFDGNFYTNNDINSMFKDMHHSSDSEVNANPVLGDIVKVFSPAYKSYYRAKILSAEGKNCFRVLYIDYGDIEMAELCNIFELSDNLKKQPGNAIQIGIDISLDKTPNEEIINMFDHLATHEIQLSMEFNESDEKGLDNCVLKVISNGLNINNEVLKLLSNESPSSLLEITS